MVNMNKLMSLSEHGKLSKMLQGYEMVEVTGEYNTIRQIKSPWELEAIQQQGAILDASLDVFRDHALRRRTLLGCLRRHRGLCEGQGRFLGTHQALLDITPFTVPTPKDLTMGEDDIINFEIVYESPWGYWLEMTTIFSFHPAS